MPTDGGQLFLFGGEFSSPSQQKFHHFRDFWMLDLATWSWEQVQAKSGPSARSGHRMALVRANPNPDPDPNPNPNPNPNSNPNQVRDKLLVFGGFFDNLREVKYYNDLHMFDLKLYKWTKITPQPGAPLPASRPD